jgi:hypothetical protein
VYREAADLAYYFHWQRGDIMGMDMMERRAWLAQVRRIHSEQRRARDREVVEQANYLKSLREQEGQQ